VGGQSAFFWLDKPQAFAPQDAFGAHMAQWIDHYLAAGGAQAHLPGRRGARLEAQRQAQGIDLPAGLREDLRSLGERCGLPFPRGR
jgi:LDH2 family malate/lactate/ureidoglycolate dehydrogenase